MGLGHQRPNLYGYICNHYVAPPYSVHISAIYFRSATFGWVRFVVCTTWQRSRLQNLRRVGENSGPV